MTPDEILKIVNSIQDRVTHSRPAYRAIADLMVSSAQKNFESQGRPTLWQEVAPSTRKEKDKTGHNMILMWSGQLKASISPDSDNDHATAFSNKVYARIHQLGGVINHPNRGGSNIFKYNKRSGKMLGFASRKAAMKERSAKARMGFIEMAFTGHSMATAITMPTRPFLLFQPSERESYTDILVRWWLQGELSR